MSVSLGLYLLNCHLNEDEEYDTLRKGEFEVCIINVNVKWSLCRCVTAWGMREKRVCVHVCVCACFCV